MSNQTGYKNDVLTCRSLNLGKVLATSVPALEAREFSTLAPDGKSHKVGFFGNGRLSLDCNGVDYKFSVQVTLIAIEKDVGQCLSQMERKAIATSTPLAIASFLMGKMAKPKLMSTGSVGFYYGNKIAMDVLGTPKNFQLGVLITANNSKGWAESRPAGENQPEV